MADSTPRTSAAIASTGSTPVAVTAAPLTVREQLAPGSGSALAGLGSESHKEMGRGQLGDRRANVGLAILSIFVPPLAVALRKFTALSPAPVPSALNAPFPPPPPHPPHPAPRRHWGPV